MTSDGGGAGAGSKYKIRCMACEARSYHQDGVVAENSLVRNSKDSKEGVRKLKEKEGPKGPLVISLWCNVGITPARA